MRKFIVISTFVLLLVSLLLTPVLAKSGTVLIVASKDNTLIETSDLYPEDSLSNGSGPKFYVGRTNQSANNLRRGLVHFDVSSALPAGARIKGAQLMLYLSRNAGYYTGEISLHRVQNDWGQGMSYDTKGRGVPAELGDATWLHTFYPDSFWVTSGGDYAMDASAILTIGPDKGTYRWESRDMVEDVQSWLINPDENFGWILFGDEDTPQSVVGFSSRETTCSDVPLTTELPPILMVTYK